MLKAIGTIGEWGQYILILILPVFLGLRFCIKSPLAKGQRMKCYYCKEQISLSATVCPYCRRKNTSYAAKGLKSRLGQFMFGFFLGGILDGIIVAILFKLLY